MASGYVKRIHLAYGQDTWCREIPPVLRVEEAEFAVTPVEDRCKKCNKGFEHRRAQPQDCNDAAK